MVRYLLLRVMSALAAALYALLKLAPTRRRVTFFSRQSDTCPRSFRRLSAELAVRDPSIEIRCLCRMMPDSLPGRVRYLGEILRQMRALAVSKVCILDGYIVSVSLLRHKRETSIIQMWHALGAIKQFGYQSLDREGGRPSDLARLMRMHANYDIVLCGSEAMAPVFAEAFGVPVDSVAVTGLPRLDYLRENRVAGPRTSSGVLDELRRLRAMPESERRTIVTYAPTHWHRSEIFVRDLAEALDPERYVLVCKPHDIDKRASVGEGFIDATGTSVLDLLLLSDCVITDYSAVAFEACAIDLPLYFYVPDIEEYRLKQGLNIDAVEEVPYAAATDVATLVAAMEVPENGLRATRHFRDRYLLRSEGSATSRIADLVFERLGDA